MRLHLMLPVVEPGQYVEQQQCITPRCKRKYLRLRQEVHKNVRDTQYGQVIPRRYECLRCHRTLQVNPQGVLAGQFSQRAKGSILVPEFSSFPSFSKGWCSRSD